VIKDVKADQFISVRENTDGYETIPLKTISWNLPDQLCQ
jgi:hypothetical protein